MLILWKEPSLTGAKTHVNLTTVDSKPFLNDFLLDAIDLILPDLPNLGLTISTMFTAGWIHFTPEFHVGRTFDPLSPELRAILVIPSTNDANERTLGSHHP
jgi:hypothetical protein